MRRAVSLVRNKGSAGEMLIGPPKSGKARVIDIDEQTLAVLRSFRAWRGSIALTLAQSDAYVPGRLNGVPRQPEHFSRSFQAQLALARAELGPSLLSEIRLHDFYGVPDLDLREVANQVRPLTNDSMSVEDVDIEEDDA